MQGTLQMFRNDGIRGMFKGNGLNCIRIIPNQGERSAGQQQPKAAQSSPKQRRRLRQPQQPKAAAAAEAAPAADVVASALGQQQQLHVQRPAVPWRQFAPRTGKPPHPADSLCLCSLALPGAAIKFLTYEQLSRKISHYLIDQGGDGQLTPVMRLLAGAGAQPAACVCTAGLQRPARGRQPERVHATGCAARWRSTCGRVAIYRCRHLWHVHLITS